MEESVFLGRVLIENQTNKHSKYFEKKDEYDFFVNTLNSFLRNEEKEFFEFYDNVILGRDYLINSCIKCYILIDNKK